MLDKQGPALAKIAPPAENPLTRTQAPGGGKSSVAAGSQEASALTQSEFAALLGATGSGEAAPLIDAAESLAAPINRSSEAGQLESVQSDADGAAAALIAAEEATEQSVPGSAHLPPDASLILSDSKPGSNPRPLMAVDNARQPDESVADTTPVSLPPAQASLLQAKPLLSRAIVSSNAAGSGPLTHPPEAPPNASSTATVFVNNLNEAAPLSSQPPQSAGSVATATPVRSPSMAPAPQAGSLPGSKPISARDTESSSRVPTPGTAETGLAVKVAPTLPTPAPEVAAAQVFRIQAEPVGMATPLSPFMAAGLLRQGPLNTLSPDWAGDLALRIASVLPDQQAAQKLRIQLSPESLGSIEVEVLRADEGVELRMLTEHAATRLLLEDHQSLLRERLAASGLNLSGFECELAKHGGRQNTGGEADTQEAGPGLGDKNPSPSEVRTEVSDRLVDLYA